MPNYIDLFAGAGGLSEGFKRAGFNPIAHVEMDKSACYTIRTRAAYHYLHEHNLLNHYHDYLQRQITAAELYEFVPDSLLRSVIHKEVSDLTIDHIFDRVDEFACNQKIDLIVGGPPCQAYSVIGRARMGKENVLTDKRYKLYELYSQFVVKYEPKYFVFENVSGILSAEGGNLYQRIKEHFRNIGYAIQYQKINAANHGVLQNRNRVVIIGKKGLGFFPYPLPDNFILKNEWQVGTSLLSDLPYISQGDEAIPFCDYASTPANSYLYETEIRDLTTDFVSQHTTRPHISRDLEIYTIAVKKWLNERKRLKYKDLPEGLITHRNRDDFGDRYKVVDPFGYSHTVVAHLQKDGHHYIYPDENNPRSVSIREAARLQSFPDSYFFEGGRTAAFRQIGNAVPPMLAYLIAKRIKELYFSPTTAEISDELVYS